ncbi:lipocalin-like, partial [Clarias magur]
THPGVTSGTRMLGLPGILLFLLGTNASHNLQDFTLKEVEGKWYLSGTASGAGWIENPKWMEKASLVIMTPTTDGDLHMNSSLMITKGTKNIGCIRIYHFLKRTKTLGTFTFYSLYYQALTEVSVVDVQVDKYVIIKNKRTTKQNVTFNLELYTRKPVVSLEVKRLFSQYSLKQRFTPAKTIFVSYQ